MFPGIIILHGDSQLGHSALHPHRPLADLGALGAQVLEDLVRLSQYAGELSDQGIRDQTLKVTNCTYRIL